MNITIFDTCPTDADGLLYSLTKYGPDKSAVIETAGAKGFDSAHRALMFVFKEPTGVADMTALVFPSCYTRPDSASGLFYCGLMNNISSEQYLDMTDMNPGDLMSVLNPHIKGKSSPTLTDRKEAIEKFLISLGYPMAFFERAPFEFSQSLKPAR